MRLYFTALFICVYGYLGGEHTNLATSIPMFCMINGAWSMAAYHFLFNLKENSCINALCGVEITAILLNWLTIAALIIGNRVLYDHYVTIVTFLVIVEVSIFLSWLIMRAQPIIEATLRGLNGLCKLVFERVGLVYYVYEVNYLFNRQVSSKTKEVVL